MDLDVRRLRILREVALRGTITAAAAALGFTPSAISQQLSALERESGTVLLERAGRRVRLTFAGQSLVEQAGTVLAALEEAQAALELAREAVGGDLRVAASGSVAQALVMPVTAELSAEYPLLHLTVAEHDPDQGLRELRLGGLDVVVAHEYDHDRRKPEPDLARLDLLTEEMLVAAPAGRFAGPVALAGLAGEIWAAEPAANTCGRAVRAACRQAGFEPDIRYVSGETGVVLAAVRTAGAVALVPRLGLAGAPAGIEILPVAEAVVRRRVFAAHRHGSAGRPSVALLLARLRVAAAGLPAGAAGEPGNGC
jgi:DNA-binding transcriptional LysR family regulator